LDDADSCGWGGAEARKSFRRRFPYDFLLNGYGVGGGVNDVEVSGVGLRGADVLIDVTFATRISGLMAGGTRATRPRRRRSTPRSRAEPPANGRQK